MFYTEYGTQLSATETQPAAKTQPMKKKAKKKVKSALNKRASDRLRIIKTKSIKGP